MRRRTLPLPVDFINYQINILWDPSRKGERQKSISTSAASACARIGIRSVCVTSPDPCSRAERDGRAACPIFHGAFVFSTAPFLYFNENTLFPKQEANEPRAGQLCSEGENKGCRFMKKEAKRLGQDLRAQLRIAWQMVQ